MRTLIAAATLLLAGTLQVSAASSPAFAGEVCHSETQSIQDAAGNIVTKVVEVCTTTGNGDGAAGGGDSGCRAGGEQIPCTLEDGTVWFASHTCYATNISAQFGPDVLPAIWKGHKDGSVWLCLHPFIDLPSEAFWVPAGQAPALVDPTVLAQRALDQMALAKPNIHLAPAPPQMTYVGLDTWLWMDRGQFASLTNTVSAGGASVTVTAAPVRAAWDMGDGSGTTCGDAGRPWVKGMTDAERTSCSYAYKRVSDFQPGGTFTVATSLVYQVDWTCAGPCLARTGSLGEVDGPTSNSPIRVGERQTVVINGGHS